MEWRESASTAFWMQRERGHLAARSHALVLCRFPSFAVGERGKRQCPKNTGALTLGRTDTILRIRNHDDVKVIHHLQHANRLIRLDLCGSREPKRDSTNFVIQPEVVVPVQGGSPPKNHSAL